MPKIEDVLPEEMTGALALSRGVFLGSAPAREAWALGYNAALQDVRSKARALDVRRLTDSRQLEIAVLLYSKREPGRMQIDSPDAANERADLFYICLIDAGKFIELSERM
jgi:hypothetical protein